MTGLVQADGTFVGGKNKNRHADMKVLESQGRSTKDKTPVFGMVQNGGKVYTEVVPDTKAKTLKPIIEKMVSNGVIIVTDEWLDFSGLNSTHAHVVMNHKSSAYVRGGFHTNGIENFRSHLKRSLYRIYYHASSEHLHWYCDEFSFRYTARKISDSERFDFSLRNIENFRLRHKELISKG